MSIPPCTTGTHSVVDKTPVESQKPAPDVAALKLDDAAIAVPAPPARVPQAVPAPSPKPDRTAPQEDESDDPSLDIPPNATCKRRGCDVTHTGSRSGHENCKHHPGQPLFHEGSKGWTCCKRRVLEFDEFLKIEGCKTKPRHCFVGRKKESVEELDNVRTDFYQTPSTVIASLFLKKVDRERSSIEFKNERTVELDLHTTDRKRLKQAISLFGAIDTETSTFKILGTKVEFTLVKSDGSSWPVLRSDDRLTGEIIQVGRAGKA